MNLNKPLSRRRFVAISAAASAAALSTPARAVEGSWRGYAMGADAVIDIRGLDSALTESLISDCIETIARLERVFSLFDEHSAICSLNRTGQLDGAPDPLLDLLEVSKDLNTSTFGAFDPTVQSLWLTEGRSTARDTIGMANLQIAGKDITLANGAQITLNGIAQGYMTDRITALLKQAGAQHVLVNLGEYRALGPKETGEPWQIGLRDPDHLWRLTHQIPLADRALATSAAGGYLFGQDSTRHHLFDPVTRTSANRYKSVSVVAPNATLADGLSTALSALPVEAAERVLIRYENVGAHLTLQDGESVVLQNWPASA